MVNMLVTTIGSIGSIGEDLFKLALGESLLQS
jgi:hypothetical protein